MEFTGLGLFFWIFLSLVAIVFLVMLTIAPIMCWMHVSKMRAEVVSHFDRLEFSLKETNRILLDTNRAISDLLVNTRYTNEHDAEVKQYVCDRLGEIASGIQTGNR